jgi:hypothetical protein
VVKYDVYVNGQKAYSTSETNFTVYNLTQGQSYTFAVKARDLTGNLSPFSNQVTGAAVLNGLNYKYYTFTGTWNSLPNFTTLTPLYTGSSANVDITPRNQDDNFAFLWEGYINIPTSGTYYFRTNSDDGSRLWLGALNGATSPYSFSGTPTVNNDGLHGTQDRTSSALTLAAGTYPIAIAFYEQGGGQSITVSWRTPSTGNSFVTIPNSAFQDAQPVLIPPAAPSDLVVTAGSYDRINLSWTDNSNNESGFEIWRSTSQSDGFITVGTAPANATSFVDSLLAPATTYYYKLRAIGLQAATRRDGRRLPLKGFYDLNPVGRSHWTYREFVEGVRPDNGVPLQPGSRAHLVMNPADNPHLPPEYILELDELPDKQRQRFRDGKYLSEVPGALWSASDRTADDGRVMPGIDTLRRHEHPPLIRVVIGVDPSGSDGTGGDCQGIVAAGLGADGHGYVLDDASCRLSPEGWAQVVARQAKLHGADRVAAEKNYGGAMVEAVLRGANKALPVKLVNASRGKHVRAEPVAALYERGLVHHVGQFPDLEEQLTMTTTAGYQGSGSPDRMDALVWALTELMLTGTTYNLAHA